MKKLLSIMICLGLGSFSLKAQQSIKAGLFAGYGTQIESPALGLIGEFGIKDKITVSPSFAYYFLEKNDFAKTTFWEFNANANYYFSETEKLSVYGLAGLNYAHSSVKINAGGAFGNIDGSSGRVGVNIGAGGNLNIGSLITPFAEIKYTLAGAEQLGIFAGIKYSIR